MTRRPAFPAWQAARVIDLVLSCSWVLFMGLACGLIAATAAPGGSRRISFAADAAGALFSWTMLELLHRYCAHDPERIHAILVRLAMVVVPAETIVEFMLPPDEDWAAGAAPDQLLPVHMLLKMIVEVGLVAPGVLGWGTRAYATLNVLRAASAAHLVWRSGQGISGHQVYVYAQTIAVLIGYSMSRVHRQLYDKETELAVAQTELARLLEASREANERREFEIRMYQQAWDTSATCISSSDESDARPATHYTAKLSQRGGSHHTTKLGSSKLSNGGTH